MYPLLVGVKAATIPELLLPTKDHAMHVYAWSNVPYATKGVN